MKFLSLNLHCFEEDNYQEKLNRIIEFVRENNIDVCLFQEACQKMDAFKIDEFIRVGNNANIIANELNYNIYYKPMKISFDKYEEGLAIVSKHEIKNPICHSISHFREFSNWQRRFYVMCNIKGLTIFNTHIGWSIEEESSINQIKNMLDVTNKHEEKFILAGDFNHQYGSPEIEYMKKHLFSLSDIAKLEPKDNPTFFGEKGHLSDDYDNMMIDYVFTNIREVPKHFEIVFKDNPVSDHYGIYFEI